MEDVLRQFVREALLTELRRDPHMARVLRRSGLGGPVGPGGIAAQGIANGWISDLELELGHVLPGPTKHGISRFVASKWQGLLARFRGDHQAARQTLANLLDAKYHALRLGE